MCVHVHAGECVCAYACMCAGECVCVCIHACVYVHMCVCACAGEFAHITHILTYMHAIPKYLLTLQEVGEEGKELLIELLMAASPYGAEESPQEEEVVAGLLSSVGQGHGLLHNLMKMGLIKICTS